MKPQYQAFFGSIAVHHWKSTVCWSDRHLEGTQGQEKFGLSGSCILDVTLALGILDGCFYSVWSYIIFIYTYIYRQHAVYIYVHSTLTYLYNRSDSWFTLSMPTTRHIPKNLRIQVYHLPPPCSDRAAPLLGQQQRGWIFSGLEK